MSISKETLEQRLRGHIGLAVSHPQFTGIVNDCYTAADEIDGLRAQLAEAQAEIEADNRNAQGFLDQIHEMSATIERMKQVTDALLNHCPDMECMECAKIICPHKDSMHFHHDGCPSCAYDYEAKEPKP